MSGNVYAQQCGALHFVPSVVGGFIVRLPFKEPTNWSSLAASGALLNVARSRRPSFGCLSLLKLGHRSLLSKDAP